MGEDGCLWQTTVASTVGAQANFTIDYHLFFESVHLSLKIV
jgi:hypothetical protein